MNNLNIGPSKRPTFPKSNDTLLPLENRIVDIALKASQNGIKDPEKLGEYVVEILKLTPLPQDGKFKIIVLEPDSATHVYAPGDTINSLEDNVYDEIGFVKWIGDLSKFGKWINLNRNNFNTENLKIPKRTSPAELQNQLFNRETVTQIEKSPSVINDIYTKIAGPTEIKDHTAYIITTDDLYFVIPSDINTSDVMVNSGTFDFNNRSYLFNFWRGTAWDKILKWRENAIS